MTRLVCVWLFAAGVAAAQVDSAPATPSAAELQQAVAEKTQEWIQFANALDGTLIRLLPCDPKAAAAINEASAASEARLAALAAYLDDAKRRGEADLESARKILASAVASQADLNAEKTDLAAERAGVSGQMVNLEQSAQGKPSFAAAQDQLKQISLNQQQRAQALDLASAHSNPSVAALRDLAARLEARENARAALQKAFETERTGWNAYYAARLARAQTECSITQPAAAPRPQGKQK